MAEEFSIFGKRLPRADAMEKVTGGVKYISDMQLPRMLYAKFLRSPYAKARIGRIDTSKAEALRGVKAILTHENTPKTHPGGKFEYLLDETVREISTQALGEVHLGVARYVLDASNNDGTVAKLRNEMMDCIALLTAQRAAGS